MSAARKGKFGVGLLLLLLGGCNAVRWKSAGLSNGIEIATYFSVSVVLVLIGLWLMLRKTSQD